jgi:PAS domain S-box-containing protein
LILTSITDVTERRANELKLQQSEEQFRSLANTMPELAWTAGRDGRRDYYNEQWYEVTGFSHSEREEEDWKAILHPDDWERQAAVWARSVETGEPYEIEHRLWDRHRREFRWHLSRALPVRDANGAVTRWFGVCTDIHEQKLAKELLEEEVSARTQELRRLLDEKETLLKEIHHRVKNNLQVVSSLLRMQWLRLSDQAAVEALKDSQARVLSMALIHDRLYGSHRMNEINFGEYTRALVTELFQSYARSHKVTSSVNVAPVILNIDQAIPCGLILNELVTNGLKYAYPAEVAGELRVELFETAENRVILIVSDSGSGLPEDFDWRLSPSLGLPIVNLLSKQINGTFTVKGQPGATFVVEFQKQVRESRSAAHG